MSDERKLIAETTTEHLQYSIDAIRADERDTPARTAADRIAAAALALVIEGRGRGTFTQAAANARSYAGMETDVRRRWNEDDALLRALAGAPASDKREEAPDEGE